MYVVFVLLDAMRGTVLSGPFEPLNESLIAQDSMANSCLGFGLDADGLGTPVEPVEIAPQYRHSETDAL